MVSGGDAADRAEQRRLAMAHRFHPEFAVGHGAGVHVTRSAADPMRAVEVGTVAVPSYEVPFTGVPDPETDDDLPELSDVILDMERLAALAETAPDELIAGLTPLVPATGIGSTGRRPAKTTPTGIWPTTPGRPRRCCTMPAVRRAASSAASSCSSGTRSRARRSPSPTGLCICSASTPWRPTSGAGTRRSRSTRRRRA